MTIYTPGQRRLVITPAQRHMIYRVLLSLRQPDTLTTMGGVVVPACRNGYRVARSLIKLGVMVEAPGFGYEHVLAIKPSPWFADWLADRPELLVPTFWNP